MTLIDTNVLLYAADSLAPQHPAVSKWLADLFAGPETVGMPWTSIWGFLRIGTTARLWTQTRSLAELFGFVRDWLSEPGVALIQPGPRHAELLERLVTQYGASGPLLSDAVLAATALEHGATLASTDRDFSRFAELKWVNPLDAA